ncbi:DUF2093 domain-containing protein [Hyphococcus lacteus]|uniref:DUF2093 domain-containing protein n=1 Tax=Hyphococcus lacteus TaxID=3143536 RepID=A0ABV3Z3Z9_9PROT
MNSFETLGSGEEAVIEYDDGDFHIVRPGSYVICAVTGTKIPLKALRYWSVDLQEPYVDAAAATKGMNLKGGGNA